MLQLSRTLLIKAVRVHGFGGPEVLKVEEIADPIDVIGMSRNGQQANESSNDDGRDYRGHWARIHSRLLSFPHPCLARADSGWQFSFHHHQ
jgi:hypothetical protein